MKLFSPKNDMPESADYLGLLEAIRRENMRLDSEEVAEYGKTLQYRGFWIRHDIDHSLEHALNMAIFESVHGWEPYRATYYFLHTADYWGTSVFKTVVRAIRLMNHDIGLHNNAVAESHRTGKPAIEIFNDAKKELEDILGERVTMTSAHGDKLCYEKGFLNYDLWKNHSLEEMGLTEAYFTRRDAYLTDSGHKWRGWVGAKSMPPFEAFDNCLGPRETIEKFNRMESGVLQLLVHPCWWEVEK